MFRQSHLLGVAVAAVLGGSLFVATPSVRADIQSYDSGTLGSSWSGLWGGCVRFTNPYPSHYMDVEKVIIRGHSSITGSLNVYLWDASGGSPGSSLASLTSQYLGSSTWNYYDLTSANVSILPGEDVFAGLQAGSCGMPYDNTEATTDRSWYSYSGSSWSQGEFGAPPDHDLMVRLQYSQGDFVPEPGTLSLLAIGGLALIRRKRK